MCHTDKGFETHFRCILSKSDFGAFCNTIQKICIDNNIDMVKASMQVMEEPSTSNNPSSRSVMRRTITAAMDKQDIVSRRASILAKRGAMKWLPIPNFFNNDLIHGSWCVSLLIVYCSCCISCCFVHLLQVVRDWIFSVLDIIHCSFG